MTNGSRCFSKKLGLAQWGRSMAYVQQLLTREQPTIFFIKCCFKNSQCKLSFLAEFPIHLVVVSKEHQSRNVNIARNIDAMCFACGSYVVALECALLLALVAATFAFVCLQINPIHRLLPPVLDCWYLDSVTVSVEVLEFSTLPLAQVQHSGTAWWLQHELFWIN